MHGNGIFTKRQILHSILACASLSISASAMAQAEFPSKPIRIVVPAVPGGPLDIVARSLAADLGKQSKVQVIVENRPGASGILAAEDIKSAPADGYSVLITHMDPHVGNVALFKTLPYDPIRDFQPLGILVSLPGVVVVPATNSARTLPELLANLAAEKKGLDFGTWGAGTYPHLVAASLGRAHNFDINPIAYRGQPPIVQDLLGGVLAASLISAPAAKAHMDSGKLRPLAVNGAGRTSLLPTVPTFNEMGYKDPILNMRPWFAAYAPARTPQTLVDRLNAMLRKALAEPVLAKNLSDQGYSIVASSVAEHQLELRDKLQSYTRAIRDAGIEPQ